MHVNILTLIWLKPYSDYDILTWVRVRSYTDWAITALGRVELLIFFFAAFFRICHSLRHMPWLCSKSLASTGHFLRMLVFHCWACEGKQEWESSNCDVEEPKTTMQNNAEVKKDYSFPCKGWKFMLEKNQNKLAGDRHHDVSSTSSVHLRLIQNMLMNM